MATATPMATMTTMPTTTAAKTVARGDLVFVVGVRSHGKLTAELILFSVPKTAVTTTPANTATVTTTAPRRRGAGRVGESDPLLIPVGSRKTSPRAASRRPRALPPHRT